MDATTKDKPRFERFKVFKSYFTWVAAAISVVGFVLSRQKLPIWAPAVIVLGVIALAYLIYWGLHFRKYLRYLRERERNHDKLMQLYGQKQSEVVERDRIISSYPKQLIENFRWGAIKGRASKSNELLPDLSKKEISILEKAAGSNGVELIFDKGTKDGLTKNTLLSIVTAYGGDLWGVVRIVHVDKNKCKGEVISKINMNFWSQVEKEMYHNPSPPPNIKARLYSREDLLTELRLMESKFEQKG
jgi:hypothetical protein